MTQHRAWLRWATIVYVALLVASHFVRWQRAKVASAVSPRVNRVEVPVQAREDDVWTAGPGTTPLAYHVWGTADPVAGMDQPSYPPTILLLHGSPGEGGDFDALAPWLAAGAEGRRYRVIAPDLAGFGGSRGTLPDYSIAAHARYALAFLDSLGIERAHVVGFSMGGGIAIEMSQLVPARVDSLVLLSAIGVQELELLGEYNINHALHAVQLGALWLLHEAVPHFGTLDGAMLDVGYARNFYDSDQRPLRGMLRDLAIPVQIVHGRSDILVPYAAALEHHRLVPQSELATFDDGHFLVFQQAEALSGRLLGFFGRVDSGTAVRRLEAPRERALAAALPRGRLPEVRGLALLLGVLLIALATGVSEDLTCIAAGLLVAQGRFGFLAATIGCFVGVLAGDFGLYAAGRWLGRPWLGRAPLRWLIDERDIARSARWFGRRGGWVIFVSRFIPGARLPTYTAAGLLHLPVGWFTIRLLIPIAISAPLLVGISALVGERLISSFEVFSRYALPTLVLTLLAIWLMLIAIRVLTSHRRRRLLVGRLRRCSRWEYWPWWALYPPVVLYVLWLGLRHRGLTLFTAANPGIFGGGFAGESKLDILRRLDAQHVAPFAHVAAGQPLAERCKGVHRFLGEQGLELPVVLKPDRGERGTGVAIIRKAGDIERYLQRSTVDSIVQAYIAGPELGIFYVRLPGAARGSIFSITEKRLPAVVGDGKRSLERLILDDPRAVVHAGSYLARFEDRLDSVPARGERFQLGELGVHSRGALFLDGAHLHTPALEDAIERISRSFADFYIGRYDLRAPSLEAFREGRGIRVIELNGITAEATHMYDPANSLLDAYRILFTQWRLGFEAGRRNRALGVRPLGLMALLRASLKHLTSSSHRAAGAEAITAAAEPADD